MISRPSITIEAADELLTDYWLDHYCARHCTLCGNSGVVDTTGVKTSAGVAVGRRNWCFCPDGKALRKQSGLELPP